MSGTVYDMKYQLAEIDNHKYHEYISIEKEKKLILILINNGKIYEEIEFFYSFI